MKYCDTVAVTGEAVRGKGHLPTCIAGRKDNLIGSILRKDNHKKMIEKNQGL